MKGWYRDTWRHSLAAKGVRTSLVANSRKGFRATSDDLVYDPEKGRYVSARHRASALGIRTGNKREQKVGDTPSFGSFSSEQQAQPVEDGLLAPVVGVQEASPLYSPSVEGLPGANLSSAIIPPEPEPVDMALRESEEPTLSLAAKRRMEEP